MDAVLGDGLHANIFPTREDPILSTGLAFSAFLAVYTQELTLLNVRALENSTTASEHSTLHT